MKPVEYCKLYPDARIFDSECLNTQTRKAAFERLKGVPKSEDHRTALSKSRLNSTNPSIRGWTHKPETIQKMKLSWIENRESRANAISAAYTPERRQQASIRQSNLIASRGYQLGRNTNNLEKLVENLIIESGYSVIRQVRSLSKLQDKFRYYDLYVKELNLLVEVDGEYWHEQQHRITLDQEKELHARSVMNYNFVRITDRELNKSNDQLSYIKNLISASSDFQIQHCLRIIQARLERLKKV